MVLTRRTGITMRVVRSEYGELRDALARDWPVLLERLGHRFDFAPEWFLLPNIGPEILSLAKRYGIQALLLTGGDDMGATPDRDATENTLLDWAAKEEIPVLGICRGAQMLACRAGAALTGLQPEQHVATRHGIVWHTPERCPSFWQKVLPQQGAVEVNSYHRWGLASASVLPACLHPAATCSEDGSIEAFTHASLPWLGLFWHPEREENPSDSDMMLLYNLFACA